MNNDNDKDILENYRGCPTNYVDNSKVYNTRDDGTSCWVDTYNQVGTMRNSCPSGWEDRAGVCWQDQGYDNYSWGCGTLIARCHDGGLGCRGDCYKTRISNWKSQMAGCPSGKTQYQGLCYDECRPGYNNVNKIPGQPPILCQPDIGAGIKIDSICRRDPTCLTNDLTSAPWKELFKYVRNTVNTYLFNPPTNKMSMVQFFFQGYPLGIQIPSSLPSGGTITDWRSFVSATGTILSGVGSAISDTIDSVDFLLRFAQCEMQPWMIENKGNVNEQVVKWFRDNVCVPNLVSINNANIKSSPLRQVLFDNFARLFPGRNIEDLPLTRYPFVVTHNAASGVTYNVIFASQAPSVACQQLDLVGQYNMNVRFFDLRVDWGRAFSSIFLLDSNALYFNHGPVPVNPVSDNDGRAFRNLMLKAVQDRQIIVLYFSHFSGDPLSVIRDYINSVVGSAAAHLATAADISRSYAYYKNLGKYVLYIVGDLVDENWNNCPYCFSNENPAVKPTTLPFLPLSIINPPIVPGLMYIMNNNRAYYNNMSSTIEINGWLVWIAYNNGISFAVDPANNISWSIDNRSTYTIVPGPVLPANVKIIQISFDAVYNGGTIVVLDNTGSAWFSNKNIYSAPVWQKIAGGPYNQISYSNGKAYCCSGSPTTTSWGTPYYANSDADLIAGRWRGGMGGAYRLVTYDGYNDIAVTTNDNGIVLYTNNATMLPNWQGVPGAPWSGVTNLSFSNGVLTVIKGGSLTMTMNITSGSWFGIASNVLQASYCDQNAPYITPTTQRPITTPPPTTQPPTTTRPPNFLPTLPAKRWNIPNQVVINYLENDMFSVSNWPTPIRASTNNNIATFQTGVTGVPGTSSYTLTFGPNQTITTYRRRTVNARNPFTNTPNETVVNLNGPFNFTLIPPPNFLPTLPAKRWSIPGRFVIGFIGNNSFTISNQGTTLTNIGNNQATFTGRTGPLGPANITVTLTFGPNQTITRYQQTGTVGNADLNGPFNFTLM